MKAWQLIEKPENWTQGDTARRRNGEPTRPEDPEATCWCAFGALVKCYIRTDEFYACHIRLLSHIPDIGRWNDTNDHATVLAKLKELDI